MKVVRADYYDDHEGNIVCWFPSKKAALTYAKERDEYGQELDPETPRFEWHKLTEVEIPTNKAGLIAWLNENFNRDNG